MKLYDVMKKWATHPDKRFYCYQTDEIWRLEGNDMMNEEDEIRVVNKYTLNFNFEEIKELVGFAKLLEEVKKDGNLIFYYEDKAKNYMFKGHLDDFLFSIADTFTNSCIAEKLLEDKFFIED